MCKAKPGPRCSDHAVSDWRTTHANVDLKNTEINDAHAALKKAIKYDQENPTPQSHSLVKGWEKHVEALEEELEVLKTKNENAMLSFYATPSGRVMLQNEISNSEGLQKRVSDGFFNEEGDWSSVSYREDKTFELNVLLNSATAHRKQQMEQYTQLHADKISSYQKLALIERQTKQVQSERDFIKDHVETKKRQTQERLELACSNPFSTEYVADLRNSKRELYTAETRLKYLEMQVKDLETAAKNIPHVEIQPIFKPSPTYKTSAEPLTYEKIQKLMNG